MTFLSRGTLAALVLLLAAAAPLSAQQRVAYVDTRKIMNEMPGRAQIEARIRTELEGLGVREKRMVDSLNLLMTAFQKDSASMTQEGRVARFAVIQRYDGQYRDTLEALQAEAQAKQNEAMQPLIDIIKLALEDVRQSDGLTMIFDLGAQVNPIVAMDKNLDVSDKVIARIRTMPAARPTAPVAEPKPAATKPPVGPVAQPAGVTRKP